MIQVETGNKPKQSTGTRDKCGIQGEENEVDRRNTSQGNRDIKSTKNSEGRLNQIEDEESSDNNNIKNGEDSVPLQTSCTTPIDIAVYPSSESLDREISDKPNKLACPSYPRRNCPAKKNPDFLWS
jgi:hypothetical protein